jgi:hypothetical protein
VPLPLPPQPTDRSTRRFASQLYGWMFVGVLLLGFLGHLLLR